MLCPPSTISTGLNNIVRDDNSLFMVSCRTCNLNSYYSQTITPAPRLVQTITRFITKKMFQTFTIHEAYILLNEDTTDDCNGEITNINAIFPIGTTLVLKMASSLASTESIGRVESEGIDVPTTEKTSKSVSILITKEQAGKLISVHITDETRVVRQNLISRDITVYSVFVFPQWDSIVSSCTPCPMGTFSGSSGANALSDCKIKTGIPKTMRRLLSVPTNNDNSMTNYIEINGTAITIINIKSDSILFGSKSKSKDFSIEVLLGISNLAFVTTNREIIKEQIMDFYNAEKYGVVSHIDGILLHSSNTSIIMGISGKYSPNNITLSATDTTNDDLLMYGAIGGGGVLILAIIVIIAVVRNEFKLKKTPLPQQEYYPVHNYNSQAW